MFLGCYASMDVDGSFAVAETGRVWAMRIFGRGERGDRRARNAGPLRFEYCCGAECDDECRRRAMHDELVRMSPRLGMRVS
jgi:hypothetical protein